MDYNIYIRSISSEGADASKPTQPKKPGSPSPTKPVSGAMSSAADYISNPDALVSQGVAKARSLVGDAARFFWPVAVVLAVAKIADKAAATASSFQSKSSGDYAFETRYDNFKMGVAQAFAPFSTTIGYLETKQTWDLQNQRNEMQRGLLGDSIINERTRKQ